MCPVSSAPKSHCGPTIPPYSTVVSAPVKSSVVSTLTKSTSSFTSTSDNNQYSKVTGEGGIPRAGSSSVTPPQPESFGIELHPSEDELNLGQETTTKAVPNLLLLGPKTLDLASKIDYKADCINVSFPRSLIKNGLYFLSVDVNGI